MLLAFGFQVRNIYLWLVTGYLRVRYSNMHCPLKLFLNEFNFTGAVISLLQDTDTLRLISWNTLQNNPFWNLDSLINNTYNIIYSNTHTDTHTCWIAHTSLSDIFDFDLIRCLEFIVVNLFSLPLSTSVNVPCTVSSFFFPIYPAVTP